MAKRRDCGFTLVELLIVIIIIGVLASISIPSLWAYLEGTNETVCLANRTTLKRYLETYRVGENKGSNTPLEVIYALDEIKDEMEKYKCPTDKKPLIVSGDKVYCEHHNNVDGSDGTGDSGSSSATTDWNQNYPYTADSKYTSGTKYAYGEIVEVDGVLYMCINPDKSAANKPGEYSVESLNTWQVVGTVNQAAVDYKLGHHYAVGTIVTDGKGNYYMFTPPYNDSRNYSNYGLTNSSVWSKIDANTSLQKPPTAVKIPANVENHKSGTTYKQGDYCVLNGVAYQYTGANASKSSINYSSVNNGTWTQVSNTYVYENASYKTGDTIWFKGKYYTATSDFTTYSGFAVPGGNSQYWREAE